MNQNNFVMQMGPNSMLLAHRPIDPWTSVAREPINIASGHKK